MKHTNICKISGLLAVNTTILAYAGIIVAAGVVVGLVLYFIATNPQSRWELFW